MLVLDKKGLYCPRGNFYIDPHAGVENAVITHAHSDHARRGSRRYFSALSGESLLRQRIGKKAVIQSFPYHEEFRLGGTQVTFFPAGHILGSAQVRIRSNSSTWVVSGDYKREPDPTCEPFEPVSCDVFITEATFGTPSFKWLKDQNIGQQIYDWHSENAKLKINSVLFAYSLGKAQRVLGLLYPLMSEPVYCHPNTQVMTDCYRAQGIALAPTRCLSTLDLNSAIQGGLFLVPQSFLESESARVLGSQYSTAFASGWTLTRQRGFDRGFVLSDHADWNDLLFTILETGAKKIYVQHRGTGALVRHLRREGLIANPISTLISGDRIEEQLQFDSLLTP